MATTPVIQNQAAATRAAKVTQGTTSQGLVVSCVFSNCTTASAANAGSASALPATPAGYIDVLVAGQLAKVPYYLP